ncbi:MAG: hypothetical protein UR66_C0016G0025 [Candidatus Moranbacteria bacterium GW2011_GWE1_35_17]|nr:MAG: hypothetical protein UR66_C0016G0025 [Candidatus Moranbacteria bacterium GW2011_GWE1_35_17]KKP68549.1 MAG: hypothetical protein UR65_C0058G0004 [Candidatus Moranbacteria bacterium GW2011_GWE2_35_164]KKP81987.1 MAG: hypothetical protein UR83_C0061G0002 [Candidatus Moranbacteria bacterium GW2011_GWF2_35_54]KKP82478.1 MAG: hypothetical protein UR82_C0038G0004 [Candidatus Moranbacteria bacterium GW2011_GWF1_35_5]
MKKILWLFVVSFFFMGMPIWAWAQESSSEGADETVIVADVNFRDTEIVFQDVNKFKIKFSLTNGEKSQANVKYSIILVERNTEGYNMLVDEYIYDEVMSLANNQKIKKEIIYVAPEYLNGKYGIMLQSKNESGLILALGDLGDINLSGNGNYVSLENCRLYPNGNLDEEFSAFQGVDVSVEENLVARCIFNNKMQKDISLIPIFETRLRSDFGEKVDIDPAGGGLCGLI